MVTLNPFYSDRFLVSNISLAGIIVFLVSCLDLEGIFFGKYHYIIYSLAISLHPRMLFVVIIFFIYLLNKIKLKKSG